MNLRIRTYLSNKEMETPFAINESESDKVLKLLVCRVISGEIGGFIVEKGIC